MVRFHRWAGGGVRPHPTGHGASSAAVTTGLPLAGTGRLLPDTDTVSVVDWGEKPVVQLINSQPHAGLGTARWPGLYVQIRSATVSGPNCR